MPLKPRSLALFRLVTLLTTVSTPSIEKNRNKNEVVSAMRPSTNTYRPTKGLLKNTRYWTGARNTTVTAFARGEKDGTNKHTKGPCIDSRGPSLVLASPKLAL